MRPKRITLANADTVGTASEAVLIDWRAEDFNLAGYISDATGADWTIQTTGEPLAPGSTDFSSAVWHSLASGSGNSTFSTTVPCTGLRLTLGSTAEDGLTLDLVQNG